MQKRIERIKRNSNDTLPLPEVAQINREIRAHNLLAISLLQEIDTIEKQITSLFKEASHNIDTLESSLNDLAKEKTSLQAKLTQKQAELAQLRQTISVLSSAIKKITQANKESVSLINGHNNELQSLHGFNRKKKNELLEKIEAETNVIASRKEYLRNLMQQHGVVSATDMARLIAQQSDLTEEERALNEQVANCIDYFKDLTKEYLKLIGNLPPELAITKSKGQ